MLPPSTARVPSPAGVAGAVAVVSVAGFSARAHATRRSPTRGRRVVTRMVLWGGGWDRAGRAGHVPVRPDECVEATGGRGSRKADHRDHGPYIPGMIALACLPKSVAAPSRLMVV